MHGEALTAIVFLPPAAAKFVSTYLVQGGYEATSVDDPSNLRDLLEANEYALAVTSRADLDMVRHIKPLPVVNIEVFFDFAIESSHGNPRRFDAETFMRRVTAVSNRGRAVSSKMTSSSISFWRLRLRHVNRKQERCGKLALGTNSPRLMRDVETND